MQTTQITLNWYLTKGRVNNHFVIGYGNTPANSIKDALKDYQIIKKLFTTK